MLKSQDKCYAYKKEMKTHCPKHNEKSNKICDDCKINREAMIYFKSYTSFEILEFNTT